MKRLLFIISFSLFVLMAFCQAELMHEAAQDVMESDSLSIGSILFGVFLSCVLYCLYKFSKKLKNLTTEKYIVVIKRTIVSAVVIAVVGFLAIKVFYSIKFYKLEKDAKEQINNICSNAETYVKLSPIDFVLTKEMNPYYFDKTVTPSDYRQIEDISSFIYEKDCAYKCFSVLMCPSIEVIFAREANNHVNTKDAPTLYSCRIRPYRMRYFSSNCYPENDLMKVLPRFFHQFYQSHSSHQMIDILDSAKHPKFINDYFGLYPVDSKKDFLKDNRILYDCTHSIEDIFQYNRINYGDFEIIYCLENVAEFGIEERYKDGYIYGYSFFDTISNVETYTTYSRFILIFLASIIAVSLFFILGKPKKNNKK